MGEMSIGEFARQSRLSQKALRLYDEQGVLIPARVDGVSGYRYYAEEQIETARTISLLRQIGITISQVKEILALEPREAANRISHFWWGSELEHSERRALAAYVVERMGGKRLVMYEVKTREIEDRKVLCLKRNVEGWQGVWDFGKEFIGIVRSHEILRRAGIVWAAFSIYHGEVNEDSDGPVEWCLPVPEDVAEELAASIPELTLRAERAHSEAYVNLGSAGEEIAPAQWQLVSESLHSWSTSNQVLPNDLGVRITYVSKDGATTDQDFVIPFDSPSAS